MKQINQSNDIERDSDLCKTFGFLCTVLCMYCLSWSWSWPMSLLGNFGLKACSEDTLLLLASFSRFASLFVPIPVLGLLPWQRQQGRLQGKPVLCLGLVYLMGKYPARLWMSICMTLVTLWKPCLEIWQGQHFLNQCWSFTRTLSCHMCPGSLMMARGHIGLWFEQVNLEPFKKAPLLATWIGSTMKDWAK